MKQDLKAPVITVVVLLAALGAGFARNARWRLSDLRLSRIAAPVDMAAGQEPQAVIYRMLDAARRGDVKAYVDCHTGEMEASLRRELAETGETRFAQGLRDRNAAVQGIAVSDPRDASAAETGIRVEYVYRDHNEVQTIYLKKDAQGWKIARAGDGDISRALIPYGTPVK